MSIVYIGIGSNLDDRQANCRGAVEMLKTSGLKILKESSLIETLPWGVEDQPLFLNMAVEAETDLRPEVLLLLLQNIEALLGRQKTVHWGPRLIDLDILFYDNLVIDLPGLKIPHPYLHERDFVIGPLAEIAPSIIHPVLSETISELKMRLKAKSLK